MIRGTSRYLSQIYAFTDMIVTMVVFFISWWLKFEVFDINAEHLPFQYYFVWFVILGFISYLFGFLLGFYSPKRKKSFSYEVYKIFQIQVLSLLTFLSILFFMKEMNISRGFLLIFVSGNLFSLGIYRFIVKNLLKVIRKRGYNKQYILILGAGSVGKRYYQNVNLHTELGYEIIGFLDDYQSEHEKEYTHYKPILGSLDVLGDLLEQNIVDEVILALPLQAHEKFGKIIATCEKAGVRAFIIPDFFDFLPSRPSFDHFGDIPLINIRDVPLDELGNQVIKRVFDISFSVIAILLTLPIMIIIAIVIKFTSQGPIIFKQERVGLNRRIFTMYKFRTMNQLTKVESDTQWTTATDSRKTIFGSILRRTSLDELPQFFNVLKGDMSVVGPRPERPYFVDQFKEEIPKYMIKHHVQPGITGWAQAHGLRGDTSIEERINHDIFYIENWTLLLDIRIIFKTVWNGLINKNAY